MESPNPTGVAFDPLSAARYGDRYLTPVLFEPLAKAVFEQIPLPDRGRLLDLACATGAVGRAALVRGASQVFGLDLDGARLAARRPRNDGCRARAEQLPYRDAAFSLVVCQHGLMFFDDRTRAAAECFRVLSPGGRLVATAWHATDRNRGFGALNRALAAELGERAAGNAAVPFSLSESAAAQALDGAGFRSSVIQLEIRVRFPSVDALVERFVRSTSLAPLVAAREYALPRIADRARADLDAFLTPDGLDFPAPAFAIVGEKPAGST